MGQNMRNLSEFECKEVAGGIAPALVPALQTAITWVGRAVVTAITADAAKQIHGDSKKQQEESAKKPENSQQKCSGTVLGNRNGMAFDDPDLMPTPLVWRI